MQIVSIDKDNDLQDIVISILKRGVTSPSILTVGVFADEAALAFSRMSQVNNVRSEVTLGSVGRKPLDSVDLVYFSDDSSYDETIPYLKTALADKIRFIGGCSGSAARRICDEIRQAGGCAVDRGPLWFCDSSQFVEHLRNTPELKSGLRALIDKIPGDDIKVVEVGSYSGESAEIFASSRKVGSIYCIDPWLPYSGTGSTGTVTMLFAEHFFDMAAERNSKIHKLKGTLADYLTAGDLNGADLVYIDALHLYDYVKKDIANAELLRPCYIAGHDINLPDVEMAVTGIFSPYPVLTFCDTSWLVDMHKYAILQKNT